MFHRSTRRVVGLSCLLLLAIPAFYYATKHGIAYVSDPELCEGDRLEERRCRHCGGTGKDEELSKEAPFLGGRCPFCRGRGWVQVILPGPKRPTRVWGAVIDVARAGDEYTIHDPENLRFIENPLVPAPKKMSRIHGAIAGARIVFKPDEGGERFDVKTDPTGRFSKRIAPGFYVVFVSAPGYETLEEEIEVKPLTEPIWLEKANLIEPPDSEAHAQSLYGLNLMVGLVQPDENGAFLRLTAGQP